MTTQQTKEKTLMGKYLQSLEPHGDNTFLSVFDTELRIFIGKTDDVNIARCSHNAILERERDKEGKNPEHYCRSCGLYIHTVGIGRVNDFLILRHPKCRGPICFNCIRKGGDVFYRTFREGLEKREVYHHAPPSGPLQ